jgi:hypothetical protein
MKLKHNKKRNTAFLYEVLIRHLTKSVLEQNEDNKNKVSEIIKKYFRKGSLLREELEIYKLVVTDERHGYHVAEKLIFEAKKAFAKMDKERLFQEQTAAIKAINVALGKGAYSVFVPSYKSLATVQQIFNDQTPIKTRVLLEAKIIHNLCDKKSIKENKMPSINNIVYKTFVKRFNDQYGETLLGEQKDLLSKYIGSFSDNGMELKIYLNEEVGRLRNLVELSLKREDIISQEETVGKIKEVLNVIDGFKEEEVDQTMVEKVLKIQSLVSEI